MGKRQAIIFDMGNVVISFSHKKMVEQVSKVTHLPVEKIHELLIQSGLGLQYERGEVTSRDLYQILREHAPKPFDYEHFIEAGCNIFTPRPEMIEVLKRLKEKGLYLLLLSNTNEAHFDYISKRYDFVSLFDAHLLSFRLKKMKPEKEIYEAAILASKTPIEGCFYIDDIPEYVAAAKTLGLEGHVYRSFPLFIEALRAEQVL